MKSYTNSRSVNLEIKNILISGDRLTNYKTKINFDINKILNFLQSIILILKIK